MTLPLALDADLSVGPQNSYHGPFRNSEGNIFTVLRNDVAGGGVGILSLHKATNPESSFAEVDTVNQPVTTAVNESVWCVQEHDIIYTVAQRNDSGFRHVRFVSANMADDTFGTTQSIETITTADDGPNAHACSIAIGTNGDIVVTYQGDPQMLMGTEEARIVSNRSSNGGSTWDGPVSIDNGGNDHWTGSVIVRGTGDRMHIFISNNDAFTLFQRRLGSDDSLETFPSAFDTFSATIVYPFGVGIEIEGTVYIPYRDGDTPFHVWVLDFTSQDTPVVTSITDASDHGATSTNGSILAGLAADGSDRHLLYSRQDDTTDIWKDEDTGAGWGTDVEEVDAVANVHISPNIYFRDGTIIGNKMGFICVISSVVTYDEVDIATAYTNLDDVIFPESNYFTGPFDI